MIELKFFTLEKLVIIPTYNEKENIESIIKAVMDLQEGFHVLIIDDGSTDDTAKVVGFTLGHDERTHDHPAFKTLLVNAVKWVGGK